MLVDQTRSHQHRLTPVEEDAADIIVVDGGFLGAGSHPQWSEKTVHQDVELVHVPVVTHTGNKQKNIHQSPDWASADLCAR